MRFSDIYIVESLTGGFSRRTGWRLHEALEPLAMASPRQIKIHYQWVNTQQELFDHLGSIAVGTPAGGLLLHLETHGSPHGLRLASGQVVTWKKLRPALTAINEATQLNLIVMVSACNGLDLVKILEPTDRAPARLILGPNRVLTDREIETANLAFYTTLFDTFDGFVAYKAMNDAIEPPSVARKSLFHAMSAEVMFHWVLREYFSRECTDKRIAARVESRVAPLALLGHNAQFLAVMRANLRAELTNHRAHFEHYRRLFFFCDVQPANSERFSVSFENCWNDAERKSTVTM